MTASTTPAPAAPTASTAPTTPRDGPPTGPNPLPSSDADRTSAKTGRRGGRGGRGSGGAGESGGSGGGGGVLHGRFVRGGPARGSFRPINGAHHLVSGPVNHVGNTGRSDFTDGIGNGRAVADVVDGGMGQRSAQEPMPGDGAYLLRGSARTGGGSRGRRARPGGSANGEQLVDPAQRGGQGRNHSKGGGGSTNGGNPNRDLHRDATSTGHDEASTNLAHPPLNSARVNNGTGQEFRPSAGTPRRGRPRSKKGQAPTSAPASSLGDGTIDRTWEVVHPGPGQDGTLALSRSTSRSSTTPLEPASRPGRAQAGRGNGVGAKPPQLRPGSASFVPARPSANGSLNPAVPPFQLLADDLPGGEYPEGQTRSNDSGEDRNRAPPPHMSHSRDASPHHPQHVPAPKSRASRKAAFGGKLTSDASAPSPGVLNSEDAAQERAASGVVLNGGLGHLHRRGRSEVGLAEVAQEELAVENEKDDLTSRLTRGLSRKPFVECPICFAPLMPSQSIWSCLPTVTSAGPTSTPAMLCCYTPFHLTCIMDWSSRSLLESREKIRNSDRPDGVPLDDASWRCPGCQKKRGDEVKRYECFCGAVKSLKSGGSSGGNVHTTGYGSAAPAGTGGASIVAPHTCGNQCSRKRSYCGHSCPLPCHAGPCPACIEQLVIPCPSHGTALAVKCSLAKGWDIPAPTCAETCEKSLICGNDDHRCARPCHDGSCPPCDRSETVLCYCGAEEKEVQCGWKIEDGIACARDMDEEIVGEDEVLRWTGRFQCERSCQRLYDCGIHSCEEGHCHPHPLETLVCPTSPALIMHCACGQTDLHSLDTPTRTQCTDPIPTCDKACPRPLSGCDHPCGPCHTGPCPPCMVSDIPVPCRCGESITKMVCSERKRLAAKSNGEGIYLCDRICRAQRNCSHHECGIRCCPLAFQAKSKGKRRELIDSILNDETSVHHCTLPCGKLLSCGVHPCPAQDHRGPCGRCLEASYEDLICACGRTKLEPPIRCGTAMPDCSFPCHRPGPSCGHPKVPHTCHEDSADCPGCPYLITKACQCGKSTVKNVRCSSTTVSCGSVCGRKLKCGGHTCKRTCHDLSDGCGSCTQVCGKNKRICGHPDQAVCHAPSACDEENACAAIVTMTCPCGNQQQRTSCGASVSNPTSREEVSLKCTSECLLRQRNSRLAEALGITPSEKMVEYPEALKSYTLLNHAFVVTVEKAFSDFFLGPKQYHVLPHMPSAKRDFVLGLAGMYRFQTELVDADPQRSVAIRRRIDSRIPHPNISTVVVLAPPKRSLGGLVDFKKPSTLGSTPIRPSISSPAPRPWAQSSAPRPFASLSATPIASANSSVRPSPAASPKLTHERPRPALPSGTHPSAYVPPHQRAPQGDDPSAPDWEDADDF